MNSKKRKKISPESYQERIYRKNISADGLVSSYVSVKETDLHILAAGVIEKDGYDFVHRSHMDVFGFYYPRTFIDWYADTWITDVYKPDRMTKLTNVNLKHTLSLGTRYKVHGKSKTQVLDVINHGKDKLTRYVQSRRCIMT